MEEILIPVVITVVSGLLLGTLLAVVGTIFAVKADETVEKIKDALPKANCGGCGYAGCEDYAKALKNGEAAPDKCTAGGAETYKALCSILGLDGGEAPEEKKAFVACGGCIDYTEDKMIYRGINTCRGANMYFEGKGKCSYGCLGLGDCVNVCPFGAISVVNDAAVVDRSKCTGCGVCTSACPNKLISLIPVTQSVAVRCKNLERGAVTRKACTHGCIGCRKCEKSCPTGAIVVENGFLARVEHSKCIACGECVKVCPTGAAFEIKEGCINR